MKVAVVALLMVIAVSSVVIAVNSIPPHRAKVCYAVGGDDAFGNPTQGGVIPCQ